MTTTPPDDTANATESPPTFDVLPLSQETRDALAAMGYTHPTPVQRAVFEPASRGVDLVVQARTGTGKTAAFGLPMIESIVRRSVARVQAIVLCPTRELALQVTGELERIGRGRGVQPVSIYGGAPMGRQVDALRAGAQVVVGTPGRVLDHLRRGTLEPDAVRMLVLDEADEMLSMGFERELHAILERLPRERQTTLFSATIPPDIERMARERLREPEFITLSSDYVGALEIVHLVYFVRGDKQAALLQVIEVENPESAIVFCNTRAETEQVADLLGRQGFDAEWLNGDLPQGDREKVMQKTRQGRLRFLVATDVAARGIDISHLTHVMNYDFPETPEQYVHRTGRTGRMGRTGTAISLILPRDVGNLYFLRLTYKIRPLEKAIPSATELRTRAEMDVVQMLADAFLGSPTHPDDLAVARRLLSHDAAERIVAALVRDHLGARPAVAEEAAAARRSRRPGAAADLPDLPVGAPPDRPPATPSEPPTPRRPARPASPVRARPPRHADLAAWTPPDEPGDDQPILARAPAEPGPRAPEGGEEGTARLYVGVGRRDGASAGDIERILVEVAGIPAAEVGKVFLRERNAFVSVPAEAAERAIASLRSATIGGRSVQAERAKPRPARSSSPNDR